MVRMDKKIRYHSAPLVLFDIDWTLLNGINNTHRESFKYAFKHCFGLESADVFDINPHGLTDTEIIFKVAEHHGVKTTDVEERMLEAMNLMSEYYSDRSVNEQPKILPGVEQLLHSLQDKNFNLGILSGNLSSIGESKLLGANINKYFDIFCFPDTTGNKIDSVLKLRSDGIANVIVLVGDTPNEILSAQSTNAKSIAVATGSYTEEDLLSLSPDLVVKTLEDSSVADYLITL